MTLAVTLALGLCVAVVWLGAIAFLRLRTPLDRLHCVSFVSLGSGALTCLAVILQDGGSARTWKTVFLLLAVMLISAASSHAIGRALQLRDAETR